MKTIPIKLQKIITCLPFVNVLIIPLFFYNCYQLNIPSLRSPKAMRIFFLSFLPLAILGSIIATVFELTPQMESVLSRIISYLIPFLMGQGWIQYQQKVMEERAQSEE